MKDTKTNQSQGGVAPFGYRWHGGQLEIDESEAPVRRLIFDLFLKYRRKKTVARMLNELGYRTRKGATFSDVAIDRLVRDSTAKGIRRELGVDIAVEPIVSAEIWERANNLLGTRELRQPVNLFSGRVTCSCGGTMSVPSNSVKYVCSLCRSKIPADDLEAIFVSQLEPFKVGPHVLFDSWALLDTTDKRLVIEHLCEMIVVARESISIRFACDPCLLEMPALGQPMEPGNIGSTGESEFSPTSEPRLEEPLLSESEAAQFLGISKMTLLRKRNAGLIGFFRIGFRILYSKEQHLVPYLEGCENRIKVRRP